ncbi:MAG: shikimate dehydrogenase [Desulfovibrionaceae bacterium]|nr:shikimate dehydrogenase [Desulfovibrionaceae bacterium]
MMKFGIIGYPLGHSLSPALHNRVYQELGIEASYQAWPVQPEALAAFIDSMRTQPLHGASVTIPHKQAVIACLDELTPTASRVGAVNTLFWQDKRLCGDNTDVAGFLAPLEERRFLPDSVLVLGAGGASRAVLTGLRHLCPSSLIFIAARNPLQGGKMAEEFGAHALPWDERAGVSVELVVNTTPMGMKGGPAQEDSPLTAGDFRSLMCSGRALAYDLVYNPLQTPFLKAAQAAGWEVQDGLDMLIAQGLEQIRLWTGISRLPDRKALRRMLFAQGLISA